jgi:hypothetical protein
MIYAFYCNSVIKQDVAPDAKSYYQQIRYLLIFTCTQFAHLNTLNYRHFSIISFYCLPYFLYPVLRIWMGTEKFRLPVWPACFT